LRFSQAYIPTQKEIPTDAVIPSHQLMIRAGLIRQLAAGIYSYLPLGWKVMKKAIEIVREEMDAIGAQELLMPMLNPTEIWDETGRNTAFGDEMFRLKDRKGRMLNLAPTHEEIICDLARKYINSYKDLPQIWYQIQTKFRDEPRPRSGVLRTRQFIMKDAYTLDKDRQGLDEGYALHAEAYKKIFSRCGLKFVIVGASSGLMGGSGSQEFMAESDAGEDNLIICDKCGYAANLEIAVAKLPPISDNETTDLPVKVHTPEKRTIKEVSDHLKLPESSLVKALVFMDDQINPLLVLVRGDHEVNEEKLQIYLNSAIRPAHKDEILEVLGISAGFIGPFNLKSEIPIFADFALKGRDNMVCGANEDHYHYTGIKPGRDFIPKQFLDLCLVDAGDFCIECGSTLHKSKSIELGHIFKLGDKYSKSMNASFLDENGKDKAIIMGSYGIGIERIVASFIEQNSDENGIIWNTALAPFIVHLIPVNIKNAEIKEKTENIYRLLQNHRFSTLLDDRKVSPGFKFKDADLLGMPIQVIIGKKTVENSQLEIKVRKTGEKLFIQEDKLLETIESLIN